MNEVVPADVRLEAKKTECQLTVGPFFQCCCTCIFRMPDHYKCTPENHANNLCFKQKGWICNPMGSGEGAISDWWEHSCGCELHTTKEEWIRGRQQRKTENNEPCPHCLRTMEEDYQAMFEPT